MVSSPELRITTIRQLYPELGAHLLRLMDEGTQWDAEQTQAFITHPDNLLLVAYWQDQPAGFATVHRLQRLDARKAEVILYEIGVDATFQRRGIATKLIEAVNAWGKTVGADSMWVLTEKENDQGRGLYRATGGEEFEPCIKMYTYTY